MVRDEKSGDCYRADKLLEEALDLLIPKEKDATKLAAMKACRTAAGSMKAEELEASIKKWCDGKASNGNIVSAPYPFNLMFKSQIGPQGNKVGYLRPETAQVITLAPPPLESLSINGSFLFDSWFQSYLGYLR
jgi:glycyl-tRNA synthetase